MRVVSIQSPGNNTRHKQHTRAKRSSVHITDNNSTVDRIVTLERCVLNRYVEKIANQETCVLNSLLRNVCPYFFYSLIP